MSKFTPFQHPYDINPEFTHKVAYFSMEFGIDQSLKTFSGGLGFLAGSHMRSAFELKQNLIGIGMLWKCGYYDQVRRPDGTMDAMFLERHYNFLEDTGIRFEVQINRHPVVVKALYLSPDVFGTVPMFFLSTDVPENDYLARSITHHLYDENTEARIAQYTVLGIGGAKLLDILQYSPETYHFNEAHALPAAFYLYSKYQDLATVKSKIIFTTHTPDAGGNEVHDINLMDRMSFFNNLPLATVRKITGITENSFNYTLVGLRMARFANAVSKLHGEVAREMWKDYEGICEISHVTNAQNKKYWKDDALENALNIGDDGGLWQRKLEMKKRFFSKVSDQTGKIFDPNVLTIVWARRFAAYKRANLLLQDLERFERILNNKKYPVQLLWAGKPYPKDYNAINIFNDLVNFAKPYPNVTVLVGYELHISKLMKAGSDVWLNTPRITREASGTSGMTAAMNGSVNFSTADGWIPEFAEHGKNAFVLPALDHKLPHAEQDSQDLTNFLDILEYEIIPTYYEDPKRWLEIVKNGMETVVPFFESARLATEYYEKIYTAQ
jgi:glycogen phosphorylase